MRPQAIGEGIVTFPEVPDAVDGDRGQDRTRGAGHQRAGGSVSHLRVIDLRSD